MSRHTKKTAVALWVLALYGCRYEHAGDPPPAAVCDTVAVTFSAQIQPLLTGRCSRCHSGAEAAAGIRIDNYEDAQRVAASGRLLGAIAHAPGFAPMPQNGPKLSDCEVAQVRKWIEGGTPN